MFHNFHPPRVSLLLPLLLCGLHIPPILIAVFQREQNQRHQPTLASRPLMSSAASSDFSRSFFQTVGDWAHHDARDRALRPPRVSAG